MMNPRYIWPSIVLAGIGIAAAVIMALEKIPNETIVLILSMMIVPVLTAFIGGQLSEIKGNVNGNLSRILDLVTSQSKMLGQSSPPVNPPAEPSKEP